MRMKSLLIGVVFAVSILAQQPAGATRPTCGGSARRERPAGQRHGRRQRAGLTLRRDFMEDQRSDDFRLARLRTLPMLPSMATGPRGVASR